VWSTDITYIRMAQGFLYLARISHRKSHHEVVVILVRQKDCIYPVNRSPCEEKFD